MCALVPAAPHLPCASVSGGSTSACCTDKLLLPVAPHTRAYVLTVRPLLPCSTTLYAFRAPAVAGTLPQLSAADWTALNASIGDAAKVVKQNVNATKQGTGVFPTCMLVVVVVSQCGLVPIC